ncbi:MAG: ATP-binding protein [Tannerellaceae bacterium]|nr:ATP-binding protein [Tannerellaceae bacterium]
MEQLIQSFEKILQQRIGLLIDPARQELPLSNEFLTIQQALTLFPFPMSVEEAFILALALMPHLSPRSLDLFFIRNRELGRPYTEFGGWKGISHTGFIPTGETALFLLTGGNIKKRKEITQLLSKQHPFYQQHILWLDAQGEGEPWLSGRLQVSEETINKLYELPYQPEYTSSFPARRITTPLTWKELILPYQLQEEIENILYWICHRQTICERWQLTRILKPGYRCLFYGPPGTGKTLTATLLGKQADKEVYRIDLSMLVSKYIGETEKNLRTIFDLAANRQWILFFDEADALFSQRTDTRSSNDRYANQEVAYLLQRIEDFPGIVILATNLKENIDEAFFRRFQSAIYFPVPDEHARYRLWKQLLPEEWVQEEALLHAAASYELSGGSMVNIVQYCALKLSSLSDPQLTTQLLEQAIQREQAKEGKILYHL